MAGLKNLTLMECPIIEGQIRDFFEIKLVKIFEPLLRIYEDDQGLKINNAEEEPGSKAGDNYLSVVVRTKVTGIRGNNDPYSATFMTKRFPRHRQIASFMRNAELFQNEAYVYTKLLPRFGSIGPKCIYADGNDIIMEDLGAQGYVVCERRNLLDRQHCQATIKALAVLHARSLALKLNNPEEFEVLVDSLIEAAFPQDDGPAIGKTIDHSFTMAIKYLTSIEKPDDELKRALDFMKSYENRCYDVIRDLLGRPKEKYHVLAHGDAWNNNIVFKHDANGRISDVKLLDFQIMRHCSLAIDFHYFVYSSAKSSVMNENYDELVKTYHTAIVQEMQNLGTDDNVLRDLSLQWLKSELKKMSLYGLFTSCWLINAVFAEDDEIIDMDSITPELIQSLMIHEVPIKGTKLERLKCILLHVYRNYA